MREQLPQPKQGLAARETISSFFPTSGSPLALQLFERSEFCNAGEASAGKTEILTPSGEKPRPTPDSAESLQLLFIQNPVSEQSGG